MSKSFPRKLYVARELENTGDEYLAADEDVISFAEISKTRRVGVYVLHEVVDVKATVELEKTK